MILSIIYCMSVILIIGIFLIYPKSKDRENLLIWIPVSIILYECFVCFVGGTFALAHIPANICSISVINIIVSGLLVYNIKINRKERQKFDIEKIDIFAFGIFVIIVLLVAKYRFFPGFELNYETSDPGTHLKYAMDCVNYNSVISPSSTMYIGQFTNALFIEVMKPVFDGVNIYKSFILKDIFNWSLSGLLFYALIKKYLKSIGLNVIGIFLTALYFCGYPLNNMLFGFVYLGITINIIIFIAFVVERYNDNLYDSKIILFMMSLGCMGCSLGYTLFAPVVFFAVCGDTTYHFFQNNIKNVKNLKEWMGEQLTIFVLPVLYTFIFIIFWDFQNAQNISGSLNAEGYIFRNLYSDFWPYIPFALAAIFLFIRKKIYNFGTFFFPLLAVYCIHFFVKMINNQVSTYYYYKLNFAMWFVLFYLTIATISYFWSFAKEYIISLLLVITFTIMITGVNIENKISGQNVNYHPFPNAIQINVIYEHNWIYLNRKGISKEFIELCDKVNKCYKEEGKITPYVGDWLQNYWFEALTNQRQGLHYAFLIGTEVILDEFSDGKYSDYMVVIKESDEYLKCKDKIDQMEKAYENEIGFVVKKN